MRTVVNGAIMLENYRQLKKMKWYEDPVYIKMSDCPEIQELEREWTLLPFYTKGQAYSQTKITDDGDYLSSVKWEDDGNWSRHIWLPTQSQLQEMVGSSDNEGRNRVLELTERFNGYCSVTRLSDFTSMEQLWLAFVMKENHNKVWDGEEWRGHAD